MNGITQFLHIRSALEAVQEAAEKGMQASDRAVSGLTLSVRNTMRQAAI